MANINFFYLIFSTPCYAKKIFSFKLYPRYLHWTEFWAVPKVGSDVAPMLGGLTPAAQIAVDHYIA
jgi:hypothetical protein